MGCARCNAWICDFSSTEKTTAFAGGATYNPTTSRIFSTSCRSGEILKLSARCGCSRNVRQIRPTMV
jgi:hypothetical protein